MQKYLSFLLFLFIAIVFTVPQIASANPAPPVAGQMQVGPTGVGGAPGTGQYPQQNPSDLTGKNNGCKVEEVNTDFGCFPNDPVGFVQRFYGIGLSFVGGISLLGLIYGGYGVMSSRGEPYRLRIAKSYLFYSVSGLLLAIFGFVFIRTVMVDILHVPGFK